MQLVPLEKLVPYVNNARTHSAAQITKLRSSLREFGFINPVIIDCNYGIIAGHGRVMAAKEEGIAEVPCVFVDYLTEAQKKAYILAELGNDYDQGLANYFTKAFEKLGGSVVRGDFTKGTSDFTSYLANAKNDKCEVIFSPTSIQYAQLIVEQSTSQGTGLPLLASDTWDSNVILNAAKGTDAKIYVTTFYQEGGNKEFDEGIKKWINEDSTAKTNNGGDDTVAAVTAMGYDAYFVALEALKKAGSTAPADVLKVLPSVTFDGVSGKIEFNETGDAKRDTAFVKNANTETGAWDFVAKQGV